MGLGLPRITVITTVTARVRFKPLLRIILMVIPRGRFIPWVIPRVRPRVGPRVIPRVRFIPKVTVIPQVRPSWFARFRVRPSVSPRVRVSKG